MQLAEDKILAYFIICLFDNDPNQCFCVFMLHLNVIGFCSSSKLVVVVGVGEREHYHLEEGVCWGLAQVACF
jgi:hypothetical protein